MDMNLLEAVLTTPADDEPRLVLADWLTERGDPRGELIRLQCIDPQHQQVGALLEQYGDTWLQEVGLEPGEGTFVRGFVGEVEVHHDRLEGIDFRRLPLQRLWIDKAETLPHLTPGLQDVKLQRLNEALELPIPADDRVCFQEDSLILEVGFAKDHRNVLKLLNEMRQHNPGPVHHLEVIFDAQGPVSADDILAVVTGFAATLESAHLHFREAASGRDYLQYLQISDLQGWLSQLPGLKRLALPTAEVHSGPLCHDALRELFINQGPQNGVDNANGFPAPDRGSGLTIFKGSRLPALRRLGVHLQYGWAVDWNEEDIHALCGADLPSLTELSVFQTLLQEELSDGLSTAPFAGQLEILDLCGSLSDESVASLIAHRDRFMKLKQFYGKTFWEIEETESALRECFPVVPNHGRGLEDEFDAWKDGWTGDQLE